MKNKWPLMSYFSFPSPQNHLKSTSPPTCYPQRTRVQRGLRNIFFGFLIFIFLSFIARLLIKTFNTTSNVIFEEIPVILQSRPELVTLHHQGSKTT